MAGENGMWSIRLGIKIAGRIHKSNTEIKIPFCATDQRDAKEKVPKIVQGIKEVKNKAPFFKAFFGKKGIKDSDEIIINENNITLCFEEKIEL